MPATLLLLWRGEMPLPRAFWGWAVLGGLLVNAITSGLFLVLVMADMPVLALLAGYVPSVPYNVLVMVGVLRAAGRYPGDRIWADAARIVTVIGLGFLTIT